MSMELDAVIERCVSLLSEEPPRSREEIAALLNRWEEMGLISQQMRAVIVQRLRANQAKEHPTPGSSGKEESPS
jgi:uncharacterized protein YmfQ (DUF2313 family)